jgi:hypothetical protein
MTTKREKLFEQLLNAVEAKDIDLVQRLSDIIKKGDMQDRNKVMFVQSVENLGAPKGSDGLMFDNHQQIEAVYAFLDILTEHSYSIYDPDGNEILWEGEWC